MSGLVSLIGAGPGDPELLTLKAARRLAEADLVLYDALVEPAALAHAARAQRFYVGKRCGAPSVTQEEINRLLVQAGGRGRRVARLKCGDPFVLGRGGEEALALAAARVPFEVVPGVSSAIAAPALAGIPVTHRGISSGFAVISGHGEESFRPALESIEPGGLTLVVLMGFASRARITELLLRRGWSASTPAAVLAGASTPAAWTWTGGLDALASVEPPRRLASAEPPGPPAAPAILCIGPCVALAAELGQAAGHGASLPVPAAG